MTEVEFDFSWGADADSLDFQAFEIPTTHISAHRQAMPLAPEPVVSAGIEPGELTV